MPDEPQLLPLNIYAGSEFRWTRGLNDEAGAPLTSTDGWTGECQVRAGYGGDLIVGFGGAGEGTCTIDAEGNVTLAVSSEVTAGLPATSGGGPNGRYVADLEVWQTSTPAARYRACDFLVRVFREATV